MQDKQVGKVQDGCGANFERGQGRRPRGKACVGGAMEDARGRPEVLARAQTYVIEKQSRQDASELRLRAKPARKGAGRASSSDVQFGSLEEGDGPDHRFQGRSQAYVRKNKDAHQDLLQQFDK